MLLFLSCLSAPPPELTVAEFERVEGESQSRNHISRFSVNEAIDNIRQVFEEKEIARRRDYRRKRAMYTWNHHPDQQDELLTCSEQEMRQSCAFFHAGESSARSILMILRKLGRIKQIPSGNGEIVYAPCGL